jgi:hypothetical protein
MTDAMGEMFVVGAIAGGGDDVAGGGVDGLALDAGMGCGERGRLGLVDDVEYFAGFVEFFIFSRSGRGSR